MRVRAGALEHHVGCGARRVGRRRNLRSWQTATRGSRVAISAFKRPAAVAGAASFQHVSVERQALLRELNDRLRGRHFDERDFEIFCECGRDGCKDSVRVTPDMYENLRRVPTHFLVKHSHAGRDDRVVASFEMFVIIEVPLELPDQDQALQRETGAARLATAVERDRAAAERGRDAAGRSTALELEREDEDIAEVLRQAARDRATAAAERIRAAADREAAAMDREEARRALAEAERKVRVAATDELTRAWTRRAGLAQITNEIQRARRTGGTVTLAFIDVDGLKGVNDSHGHAAGDRLLRLTAETMRAHLRPYDIVTRYGGDEFLCAMPNISRTIALERMTAITGVLATIETGNSISFGVAVLQPNDGLQELVERADAELLAAKRSRTPST